MESRSTPASRLAGVLIASGALSLVALGAYFLVPLIEVQSTGSEGVSAVLIEVEEAVSEEGVAEEVTGAIKPSEFDHGFVIEFDDSIEFLKDADVINVKITGSGEPPSIFNLPAGEECDFTLQLGSNSRDEDWHVGYIRVGEPNDESGNLCGIYVADYDSPMPN